MYKQQQPTNKAKEAKKGKTISQKKRKNQKKKIKTKTKQKARVPAERGRAPCESTTRRQ